MTIKSIRDFDSCEEFWFYNWLKEAERYGLITDIIYQPVAFELSPKIIVEIKKKLKTKVKKVDKFLLHNHNYTPDFSFSLNSDSLKFAFLYPSNSRVFVDIKGHFGRFGDHRSFSINQKWMFQKFGLYVEKIVPEKLFKKTWVPEVCRWTERQHKPVKKYIGVMTVGEFVHSLAA